MPVKAKYLNEKEIIQYYQDRNIDTSMCYCKECGKFLVYDNAIFHIHSYKDELVCDKLSFLTTRIYNGHEYRLCRCYDCICKKYPDFKNVKFKFAHKAAKYTQYAFDVSDEDFQIVTKARQSVTKEKMIKKYGETEGMKRWKTYCQKQSETNKFPYKQQKYGMTQEDYNVYNSSRAVTLNNLIKKHGITEGNRIWQKYIDRQSYTCSKQYFIETYGDVLGLLKYDNFCNKRSVSGLSNSERFSPIGYELSNEIAKLYPDNKIYFGNNEFAVTTNQTNHYYVDYYDETENIVIEFYGDFFHFNPIKYKPDEHYFTLNEGETVKDKWKADEKRIQDIQQALNCKIIIVWESTYKHNKKYTIETITYLINNKNNAKNITEL